MSSVTGASSANPVLRHQIINNQNQPNAIKAVGAHSCSHTPQLVLASHR